MVPQRHRHIVVARRFADGKTTLARTCGEFLYHHRGAPPLTVDSEPPAFAARQFLDPGA
jgi:hypothetical protein